MIYKKSVIPSIKCKMIMMPDDNTHHTPAVQQELTPLHTAIDTPIDAERSITPRYDIIPYEDAEVASHQDDDITPIVRAMKAATSIVDAEMPNLDRRYNGDSSDGESSNDDDSDSKCDSVVDTPLQDINIMSTLHIVRRNNFTPTLHTINDLRTT